jgi:hypothetical protein
MTHLSQTGRRRAPRYYLHAETKVWLDRSSVSALRLRRSVDDARRARRHLRRVTLDRARHCRHQSNGRSRAAGGPARGRQTELHLPRLRQGFQAGVQARLAHPLPRRVVHAKRKSPVSGTFIGAPRFELGTSSPPAFSGASLDPPVLSPDDPGHRSTWAVEGVTANRHSRADPGSPEVTRTKTGPAHASPLSRSQTAPVGPIACRAR